MKTRGQLARGAAALAVLLIGATVPLAAQEPAPIRDVHSRSATRSDLEAMVEPLQAEALAAETDDYQERLRIDLAWLGYRLREGDIWAGDVISLAVSGEADWTGTFTVTPDRALALTNIEPIPLGGLLYSEIEGKITEHLAKYLREPRVQVEALKRIAVLGGVRTPGFFSVSGSTLVSDLIMQAGGPASGSNLDDVEFRRLGQSIGFDGGGPLASQAYSLDQLGIMSGDELHVPVPSPAGNFWQNARFVVLGVTAVILALTRIF